MPWKYRRLKTLDFTTPQNNAEMNFTNFLFLHSSSNHPISSIPQSAKRMNLEEKLTALFLVPALAASICSLLHCDSGSFFYLPYIIMGKEVAFFAICWHFKHAKRKWLSCCLLQGFFLMKICQGQSTKDFVFKKIGETKK